MYTVTCFRTFSLALIFFMFFQDVSSQTLDSIKPQNILEEVTISGFHLNDSLMNATASIGIISRNNLQRNNLTDISPAINLVPGVLMQTGAMNTNRITIRGVGARTPFGTNKIRAFFGNIPLTSGDSETTVEDLNIETLSNIEIIKGPLSSLYGAGLGGAIILTPISNETGTTAGFNSTFGSFGLVKNNYRLSAATRSASVSISYHRLTSEGWRQNNSYEREGLTVAGEAFRTKKGKLTFLANYTYMNAYIASSINENSFENNPQSAAPTWLAAKGYEKYHAWLGGLGYESKITGNISNSTSAFINAKKSDEPRPFDILKQDTKAYGLRTHFSGSWEIGKRRVESILGAEIFADGFSADFYENRYQENNGQGSLQGDLLNMTSQDRMFYNIFAQVRVPISNKTEVQAGVNYNDTRFEKNNEFPESETGNETYSYDPIWSPQLSFLYKPTRTQTFYFSASRGFSLPGVEETLTASGNINSEIKPETGTNYEVGSKSYFFGRRLFLEASLFRMMVSDLLVAKRIDDDQYIGVNAGSTLHQGVEAAMRFTTTLSGSVAADVYFSGSVGNFTFEEFTDSGNDYSGNELTGVSKSKANAGVMFTFVDKLYLSCDFLFVDGMPINDANTVYAKSYRVTNLKAGYKIKFLTNFLGQISVGANNIFGEKYASMVLVNATAPPNGTPRYYYPGNPVNYYLNFGVEYDFNN